MIQFWSNTPVYIALVSSLELLLEVSDCFLEHQSMRVLLKIWTVDVTESQSDIPLTWSTSKYVLMKLDYSWYCWFLYLLLWSNISGGFHKFYRFHFLSIWWVHVDGAWGIIWHVWDKGKQVLLANSCSHWVSWWYIEDHSKFG